MSQRLPPITKRIIYLDQFVLSNILAAKDNRWSAVYQRLKLLSFLQLIVCPYSRVHQEESLLADSTRDALKALYQQLSNEAEFRSPNEIIQSQLLDAIGRYLRNEPAVVVWHRPRPWREFCQRDPHRWTLDESIFADFPFNASRVARLKTRKQSLHADLQIVANNWKDEDRSFAEDVQREVEGFARPLLDAYRHLAGGRHRIEALLPGEIRDAFRAVMGPVQFNPRTPPGIQPGVQLVHWLAAEVHHARPDESDPIHVVDDFLHSPHAATVPFQYVGSRLWATIAQRVRNAKGPRDPKSSDNYDVTALSCFGPYCDAMVIDNEFRAMGMQRNIDLPAHFGVRLYSTRTLDNFVGYLDDLLLTISTHASAPHQAAAFPIEPASDVQE